MRKSVFLLCISALVLIPTGHYTAYSASRQAIRAVPNLERRSIIQSVEVSVDREKNASVKKLRRECIEKARARILGRGKECLESETRLGGVRFIEYRIIEDRSGRPVNIISREDCDSGEKDRYKLSVKGEVEYELKNSIYNVDRLLSVLMNEARFLTVRIWTDKRKYRKGEKVKIFFEGNRDFYGKVVKVSANGEVIQLIPNNYRQISSFEKGKIYTVPGKGDRFDLEVSPPFGTERIIVYASDAPLSQKNMKLISKGLYQYRSKLSSMEKSVRSCVTLEAGEMAEFYEAIWEIESVEE